MTISIWWLYSISMSQLKEISAYYSLTNKDYWVVEQMARGIRQTAAVMGVTLDESTLVLRPAGSDMHESCACRMGYDPATSTTNIHGQVHGVKDLYVADNSVLPSLSAVDPVLSNVA